MNVAAPNSFNQGVKRKSINPTQLQEKSSKTSNTPRTIATKTAKFLSNALSRIQNPFSEPPTREDIGSGIQKAGYKALTMTRSFSIGLAEELVSIVRSPGRAVDSIRFAADTYNLCNTDDTELEKKITNETQNIRKEKENLKRASFENGEDFLSLNENTNIENVEKEINTLEEKLKQKTSSHERKQYRGDIITLKKIKASCEKKLYLKKIAAMDKPQRKLFAKEKMANAVADMGNAIGNYAGLGSLAFPPLAPVALAGILLKSLAKTYIAYTSSSRESSAIANRESLLQNLGKDKKTDEQNLSDTIEKCFSKLTETVHASGKSLYQTILEEAKSPTENGFRRIEEIIEKIIDFKYIVDDLNNKTQKEKAQAIKTCLDLYQSNLEKKEAHETRILSKIEAGVGFLFGAMTPCLELIAPSISSGISKVIEFIGNDKGAQEGTLKTINAMSSAGGMEYINDETMQEGALITKEFAFQTLLEFTHNLKDEPLMKNNKRQLKSAEDYANRLDEVKAFSKEYNNGFPTTHVIKVIL